MHEQNTASPQEKPTREATRQDAEYRPLIWPSASPRCADTHDMFNEQETRNDG